MDDETFMALVSNRFSSKLEDIIQRWMEAVYGYYLIEDAKLLEGLQQKGIVVYQKDSGIEGVLFKEWEKIRDLTTTRENIGNDPIVKITYRPSTWEALVKVTSTLIQPDLSYDEEKTKQLQEEAAAKINDVVINVQSGESIIRKGDRYDERSIKIIEGILKTKAKTQYHIKIAGIFVFLLTFLFILYSFGRHYILRFRPARNDLVFFGTLGLFSIVLIRLLFIAIPSFHRLISDVPASTFYYLIPVAASVMLVRLMVNAETTTFFAVAFIGINSLMFPGGVGLTVFYMTSRAGIFKAGFYTGLVNAFLILAANMIYSVSNIGDFVLGVVLWKIGFGFLGGIFSSVLVMVLTPLAESAFNYLTDIKLLEYGSLNHPLLRELIVRAPGTYHHSHMVGTLSEAGCDAIGANGLFARVACYFHDIGKMKKSEYFIENQKGDNRHERLSPSMSALIIASHVKDGIELARSHKLPQRIIDIIPQHQGKKLISYFYVKAKEMEKVNIHSVKEENYRYSGPKPQTREAGVILLADTVEAATRSLKDRSPSKLRSVVQNMINKNFSDGQLDECDMTLRDLHTIADQFTRILIGIYHQRVEYPDFEATDEEHPPLQLGDKFDKQNPIQGGSPEEDQKVSSDNIRHLRS